MRSKRCTKWDYDAHGDQTNGIFLCHQPSVCSDQRVGVGTNDKDGSSISHVNGSDSTSVVQLSNDNSQFVALDCEFVGVGLRLLSALGRCSIVDYCGHVICDIYARPDEPITDYRTRWSGIRKCDMIRAIPIENARSIIKNILRDKVVVGHALHNDLSVLRMEELIPPENRRDTSLSFQLRKLAGLADRPVASLKALTLAILGRRIQAREHDSVDDARASMELFKRVQADWTTQLVEPVKSDKQLLKRTHTEEKTLKQPQSADRNGGVKRRRLDSSSESMLYLSDDYWPDDLHVCWF